MPVSTINKQRYMYHEIRNINLLFAIDQISDAPHECAAIAFLPLTKLVMYQYIFLI